ncbi:MAG: PAS domain S-box protein [Leptolyngbyaceae cyanobacterium]
MVCLAQGSGIPNLLLVGNDPTTQDLLLRSLQESLFKSAEITITQSIDALIKQTNDPPPVDLILLDADVLGQQATDALKNLSKAFAELPILLVCEAQSEGNMHELMQSDIQGLLIKESLNAFTLSHTLKQALNLTEYKVKSKQQLDALFTRARNFEYALDNTLCAIEQIYEHNTVLEGILNAMPDAVVFADKNRRVCKVNPAFSEIFNCSPDAILGQTTEQLYENSAGYQAQGHKRYNPQSKTEKGVYEERYRRQGGEVFVGETVGTAVKSSSGQCLGYLGIIRDVTQRKQLEIAREEAIAALRQSETVNRALLKAIPDTMRWMKLEGNYLTVSEAFLDGEQAFSEATIHDYLTEDLAQQKLEHARKALATGEVQEYEREIPCQGQVCYEEVRISACGDSSILALIRDITSRKQSEKALQVSEARYRALYQKTPVMLHSIDHQGCLLSVSDYWLEKLGYSEHEVIGRKSSDFLTPESQHYAKEVVLPEYFKNGFCKDVPYQMVTKTGGVFDVLLSATAERDDQGQITRSLAVMTDVTERNKALAAVEAGEIQFQAFMDNSPALAFMKDAESGQFIYINQPFQDFFGVTPADLLGKTDFDWLPRQIAENNRRNDQAVIQSQKPLQLVESVPDPAGNPHDWLVYKFPFKDLQGKEILGGVALNISEQKRLERQLHAEKELAQVTLHSIGDAVITTDAKGCVNYFNPVAETLTGWTQKEAEGLPLIDIFVIVNERTRKPVDNPVEQVLEHGITVGLASNTILISKDGTEYGIEDSAAPIRNAEGEMIGAVLVFHDVTEARLLSQKLSWQATHDELTHLANRREFERRLETLLNSAQEFSVLCYIDLDQFKLINDTCGHAAGDALLIQVSDILASQVRATDTVARLGGDEFAILLRQCSLELARRIANLVCQSVREHRFIWENQSFSVGASIGLVEVTPKSNDIAAVLAAADGACYAAKEAGRNRVHVYRADDAMVSQQRDQQQWCLRIDQALETNRFCLYHQPIATADGCARFHRHTELLVRMLDGQGQLVSPMAFIPAAERYNRMTQIDTWVICRFLKMLSQSQIDSEMLYNINLSGVSLSDKRFLKFLKRTLSKGSIDPRKICFEITETAAISNLIRATIFMRELKQLGCQFALDDFGSGMSSFGYLKELPVDYIKIDGAFIQKLNEPINRAIVISICNIGQAMKVKVIAERVEDARTATQLKELGVDYVQGHGIAKPMPFLGQHPDAGKLIG